MRGLLFPLLIIAAWLGGSAYSLWNSYIIPPPWEVLQSAQKLIADGVLTRHVLVSLYRVFVGFLITLLIAFPLGVVLGMFGRYRGYFQLSLEFVRHVPPLATLPMLILWFGIGEAPKLLIVVLATFFPIFLNTMHGVVSCDHRLIEVGRSFGFSNRNIFRRIVLPSALPSVLVGMRLGLGYSWRALVGAELIAASSGIGYMILDAEQLARPDIVLLGIITIGTLGTLIDWSFFRLTRLLIPWKETEGESFGRG